MSGYQLGLVLFGTLLAGFGLGIVAVWAYARHVMRTKFGALADALTATAPLPPPDVKVQERIETWELPE